LSSTAEIAGISSIVTINYYVRGLAPDVAIEDSGNS
jgi:hypothetical protein